MRQDTRERFQLFIEKAMLLEEWSYQDFFKTKSLSWSVHWQQDNELATKANHPSEEALHAVATTLRFFIQQREKISLGLNPCEDLKNTMDEVLDDISISQEWKDHYNYVVGHLRARFAGRFMLEGEIRLQSEVLIAWNVFETMFYGDIVHANPKHRLKYQAWQNFGDIGHMLLWVGLHGLIYDAMRAISYIARFCKDELHGKPILPLVIPQTKQSQGDCEIDNEAERSLTNFTPPSIFELADANQWTVIPESFVAGNVLGWVCTVLVFDKPERDDIKGVLLTILDARNVISPSEVFGRYFRVDTYGWSGLSSGVNVRDIADDAINVGAHYISDFLMPVPEGTEFDCQWLPPNDISQFLDTVVHQCRVYEIERNHSAI